MRLTGIALILLASLVGLADPVRADSLDEMAKSGTIRIGYRSDAAPFSSLDAAGHPAGYTIDICDRVVAGLSTALGKPLAVTFVAVTAENRLDMLKSGAIDLDCESASVTMTRRESADFSLLTFVTGATIMVRADSAARALKAGETKVIGVLSGSTAEASLRKLIADRSIPAEIILFATYDTARTALDTKQIDSFFADREILYAMRAAGANPEAFLVGDDVLTYEPYAIAMRKGDDRLRLGVDRVLASLYRTGAIAPIFSRWFPGVAPSALLGAMYTLGAIPE